MSAEPETILRLSDVCARTGLGKTSIYRLISSGDFPTQVQITPGARGWFASEVTAWIMSRPRDRAQLTEAAV